MFFGKILHPQLGPTSGSKSDSLSLPEMETALSGGIVDDDDGSVEIFEARVETSPQIVSLSDTQSSISTPDTLGRERWRNNLADFCRWMMLINYTKM